MDKKESKKGFWSTLFANKKARLDRNILEISDLYTFR